MGIVASGTNNARLAGMLRNLAQFYHKEPSDLFMVRLAQVRREGGEGVGDGYECHSLPTRVSRTLGRAPSPSTPTTLTACSSARLPCQH